MDEQDFKSEYGFKTINGSLYTANGLKVYCIFTDAIGNDIIIQQGTRKREVNIFCRNNEKPGRSASPYLTREQAKMFRDALTLFIEE
jgi:hypothetical protein